MNAGLEKVRERCYIDEDTGCWLWRGAVSQGKWPRVYAPDHSQEGSPLKTQTGRRAVWHLFTGKAIPNGWRVYGTCTEDACLNPQHMKCGPTSELGSFIAKSGEWKGVPARIKANRLIARTRAKVTPDMVSEINQSNEKGLDLAQRLNVSDTLVSRVRRGASGKCWQPMGGVFSGLMR